MSNRYFRDEEVCLPVVVYMPPEVYAYFTYASWLMTQNAHISVVRIPICIMQELKRTGLGLALKVESEFASLIDSR